MFIDNEAVRAGDARPAGAVFRQDYESCFRVLEARVAEWVRSGRNPSRLLEADELPVVRRWLRDARAWGMEASNDLQHLLAGSEAAQARRAADARAESARRRGRLRLWLTAAIAVLAGAVVAIQMPG